ncbi:hypothetical protein THAOC_19969 [Thalassiosira oceanica]|uniref:Uncharacterized protein n=1 Tax=Thalassiosira oceanica TaxID=159749 RepID=K0S169_THAOC|nr:hypothetical protein THAOC_19969 [Thalassiosira oceanica]|eukprot:EJK59773.1 hypothetical protein THAOC_19969 [Thalassiosira oceanica]
MAVDYASRPFGSGWTGIGLIELVDSRPSSVRPPGRVHPAPKQESKAREIGRAEETEMMGGGVEDHRTIVLDVKRPADHDGATPDARNRTATKLWTISSSTNYVAVSSISAVASTGSTSRRETKGDTGADGAAGSKGDTGADGDTGAAGSKGADGADGADGSKGASGHQSSPRRHLSWPGGPQRMTAPGWTDQQVWSCVRGLQKNCCRGI